MHSKLYYAAKHLSNVYSFVRVGSLKESLVKALLPDTERAVGAYINHRDDTILISDQGLHRIKDGVDSFIPYQLIQSVELPEDDNYRELKLYLHDGKMIFLPLLNDSEEEPDLYPFFNFLSSIIYWPLETDDGESICEIECREDLIEFLEDEDEDPSLGKEFPFPPKYQNVRGILKNGFPNAWDLRRYNISPDLLNRPDTWRLLALCFLLRENADEVQEIDERASDMLR